MTFLTIVIAIILLELIVFFTVRTLRKDFQWLITAEDEYPTLDPNGLKKFFGSSYDPELGWVRRPNTTGKEKGQKGEITFHVDDKGARLNPYAEKPSLIAAFGDSYVFARQVEDDETWEVQLSEMIGYDVMNFGVGNYGADQGLIRYERTQLSDDVKVAILGFVPETICRVHSYWKHYLEFGNTFAFKPRFKLDESDELFYLKNPMKSTDHFQKVSEMIPEIAKNDEFYKSKFRSLQFRFPYLISFLRHPVRHSELISTLLYRASKRLTGAANPRIENMPFKLIMKYNILGSHRLYKGQRYKKLLKKILLRFKEKAEERGHIPLILVMPQLLDLELTEGQKTVYQTYFKEIDKMVDVIDMTDIFKEKNFRTLYIDDQYGGHLSVDGNRLVADEIKKWLLKQNLLA